MDLSTLARVKEYVTVGADTSADALLSRLISSYSAQFEQILNRFTQEGFHVETVRVPRFRRFVSLRGAPLIALTSIKVAETGTFTSITALDAATYRVDKEAGSLELIVSQPFDPAFVEIRYVGGMAPNTTQFVARFPRIAEALDQQVAEHYQRRDRQGGNASVSGGSTSYEGQLKLLAGVEDALAYWKRRYA